MIINCLLILAGFILLIKGADWLVDGASGVAKKFHIPEIIIGLTIVSIGTSMPELFVSITSSIQDLEDISLGNVIGSNICNLLLILGLSATINPVIFKKETRLIEIPLHLVVTIIFLILCNIGNDVSRIDSVILILLFIAFLIYTIVMGKKGAETEIPEKEEKKSRKTIWNIIFIIIGIIALKFGGDFVVDNAKQVAEHFNISQKIIGLTIVAIGTSLPELVTSVTAALKKNSDIAIGNIIGSNIFNMLLIIGAAAAINPMTYNTSYNLQMIILIVASFVLGLFPYTDRKDEMTQSNGITYLMLYALYMVVLFVK